MRCRNYQDPRTLSAYPARQIGGQRAHRGHPGIQVRGVEQAADQGTADDHPVGVGGHLGGLGSVAYPQANGDRRGCDVPRKANRIASISCHLGRFQKDIHAEAYR